MFAYCLNLHPLSLIDTDGEFAFLAVAGAVMAVSAIIGGIDFLVNSYYDYQILKELTKQEKWLRDMSNEIGPCYTEKSLFLDDAINKNALEQVKNGVYLGFNFISIANDNLTGQAVLKR